MSNESRLADEVERLQDELADTQAKLTKLRDSHDSWRRVSERLCAERNALSAQRDELQAVHDAAATAHRALLAWQGQRGRAFDPNVPEEWMKGLYEESLTALWAALGKQAR